MTENVIADLSDKVKGNDHDQNLLMDSLSDTFNGIHGHVRLLLSILPTKFLSLIEFEFLESKELVDEKRGEGHEGNADENLHVVLLRALINSLPRIEQEVELASKDESNVGVSGSYGGEHGLDVLDLLQQDSEYLNYVLDMLKFIIGYLVFVTCSYNEFNRLLSANINQLNPEKIDRDLDFSTKLPYLPYLVRSFIITHRHDLSLAITENILSLMLPLLSRNEKKLKEIFRNLSETTTPSEMVKNLRSISLVTLNYLILHESFVNKAFSLAYSRKSSELEDLIIRTNYDLENLISILENSKQKVKTLPDDQDYMQAFKRWIYILQENVHQTMFALKLAGIGLKQFYMGSPTVFFENESKFDELLPFVDDPWLLGFYFNIKASFYMKMQDIKQALTFYLQSQAYYEFIRDTRGLSVVTSNISHCYYYLGRIDKAITNLEKSVYTFLSLKDVFQATGNLLLLAKYHLDANHREEAKHYLNEASKIAKELPFKDPIILSLFIYIHGNLGQIDQAKESFKEFEELKKAMSKRTKHGDILALQWAKFAEGMVHLYSININDAITSFKTSLDLADTYKNFQLSVDAVTFLIEAYFKAFLVTRRREYILEAFQLLERISLLLSTKFEQQSPYPLLFNMLHPLTLLALGFTNRGRLQLKQQLDILKQNESILSVMFGEHLPSFNELETFLYRIIDEAKETSSLTLIGQKELIFVDLAIRILKQIQLRITALGMQAREEEALFQLLLVFNQAGLSVFMYTHPAYREQFQQDPQLIGGFLTAIRSFSNELFGEGLISKIEFDGKAISERARGQRFVIIQQKITSELTCVVIANSDSYELRVGLENFRNELRDKRPDLCLILENSYLTDENEVMLEQQLTKLVETIFSIPPDEEAASHQKDDATS